jgi:hypothetical protein
VFRTRLNGRLAFLLVSAVVLAFACGPRPRASDSAAVTHTPRARAPRISDTPLSTVLDVRVNNGVSFAFHVTNATGRKLEVNFRNGQTHDLIVLDTLGREVWRWSQGRMFTQALQNKVLHESDSLSYDLRWANAPAGRYTAVATLASNNFPVEQRAEFVVR